VRPHAHQDPKHPFRLTRFDVQETREGLEHIARVRREEIDGFVEGLFGSAEAIDLPEKAHRALNILSEIRAMLEGVRSSAADETIRNFVFGRACWVERSPTMPRRKEPHIPDAILDQLLAGADPKTAFDPNGLLDGLKKALAERALNAEMDHHLAREETGNSRNGYGRKTVVTDTGKLDLQIPRDRQASFDPQLIAKYQRRFPGFDDKVISMYARGMSTREIVGHVRELYGIEVSPDLISAVTDAVLDEIAAWQARPLEPVYPLIFFDALRVKIREEALVRNKAVHVALGVRADGTKEILGLWIEQTEGAKFWLRS